MTGRRGRRRSKLLDDLKERRGYSHLKGEALDRTMWRGRRGRRRRKLLDDLKERRGYSHLKGGSSRSHYVERKTRNKT